MPYLHDVPHFLDILIHSGNTEADSAGCIIVGGGHSQGRGAELAGDYPGIIAPEAPAQLTCGNGDRFIRADEAAEMSVVEYLSENYEVEKELAKGKYIADYDAGYNDYELSEHEYVVYGSRVFYPETDVNADTPQTGWNLSPHDPPNYNLKKHMVRLALYELMKLIAPNDVSVVRMRDYEDSMKWLNDAAKLRLNPQISRKLDETKKPVADWQLASSRTDYDPKKNTWIV